MCFPLEARFVQKQWIATISTVLDSRLACFSSEFLFRAQFAVKNVQELAKPTNLPTPDANRHIVPTSSTHTHTHTLQ